jgi:2-succinyl-5-enolpyruvyl-6-hydroxy-3-cyclohexene-1-carboxylate synthase
VSESSQCARAVIGQLIAQGVTDVVLAPGSRSAPLALCLEATARAGDLRLQVRVDERSAGFLALGLAKGTQRPVAVVTTSGTAVGNLLPAVLEAHHGGVPLVVVSADRPSWLIGVGANQATEQGRIFDGFTRYTARVAAAAPEASWRAQAARAALLAAGATGGRPGPAHLNLELPEPLIADESDWGATIGEPVIAEWSAEPLPVVLDGAARTVVICGDASVAVGEQAVQLAEAGRWPLIAEPSSNARWGANAVATGRLLLAGELGGRVERVVVFGHPTLSRPVNALLGRTGVEVIVVTGGPDYPDPGWRAGRVVSAATAELGPADWLDAWRTADAFRLAQVIEQSRGAELISGPELAATVVAAVPADQLLCLGNSNPIRDADLAPIGTEVPVCYANRGLAGIDGTVSTAVGIALGAATPTTLLCGDLSFVHDLAGLVIGPGEPRPQLRIVVADDGGGSIFATLEYGAAAYDDAFERVFATPTGLDLAAVTAGYGVPVRRLRTVSEVAAALSEPVIAMEVLIVDVDRTRRRELDQRV